MNAVFDSNILIDYLNGVTGARDELDRFDGREISVISWMEVLVGTPNDQFGAVRRFLSGFRVIEIDGPIAEEAVSIRRSTRIRLPDALIWATARVRSALLVTRNTRDFPADDPGVRVPYRL